MKYFRISTIEDNKPYYAAGLTAIRAQQQVEDVVGPLPPARTRVVEVERRAIPEGAYIWGEGEVGDPEETQ